MCNALLGLWNTAFSFNLFKNHWKSVCSEIIVAKYFTGQESISSKENNIFTISAEIPMESVIKNICPTPELKT